VKGRARHPQSQGCVERGIHVVNAQLNPRPSRAKGKFSPNQIFFGKERDKLNPISVLGIDIAKLAKTEDGIEAAYKLVIE
jgi:hypothetical protein